MSRSLMLGVVMVVVLAACDWTGYAYNGQNSNFNPYEPGLTDASVQHLSPVWSASCVCGSFEPANRPLVSGGMVYVLDGYTSAPYSLSLRAFDASNGQSRWSTPLGPSDFGDYLAGTANGLVYVAVPTTAPRLIAIDAASGAVRWQMTPPAPATGAVSLTVPVVDGLLVFVAATANGTSEVSAIDTTGRIVWSATPGGDAVSESLTVDPGHTLYAVSQVHLNAPPGAVTREQSLTIDAGTNRLTPVAATPSKEPPDSPAHPETNKASTALAMIARNAALEFGRCLTARSNPYDTITPSTFRHPVGNVCQW